MDIDIGFWLSLLVLITGGVWAIDKIWKLSPQLAGDVPAEEGKAVSAPGFVANAVEFSNGLLPVFLVVLVVRSFIFEPFTIPSGSMIPTLQVHDFIVVNKFSYGLRLPVTNTLVVPLGEPERGDVMVFRYPEDPGKNYIKRVVGLPGDKIRIRGEDLYVNGEKVGRRLLRQGVFEKPRLRGLLAERSVYVEQLGASAHLMQHETFVNPHNGTRQFPRHDGDWTVPEDGYFVLGDNREDSKDSRFWGFVPKSNIVGKASVIWMHWRSLTSLPSFTRNGVIDKAEEME